jgi:hypothetical protein
VFIGRPADASRTASVSVVPGRLFHAFVRRHVILALESLSLCVGVGHHEEPRPLVWSANVRSSKIEPKRIIPRFGKLTEHDVESARSERRDVLHDNDARSSLANDSCELEPQTASRTSDASSCSRERHVLAGEPTTEDVDARGVGADGSHVVISKSVGPVSREDAAAPRVLLALPDRRDIESSITQRAFEPEVEPADPREQRPDRQWTHHAAPPAFLDSSTSSLVTLNVLSVLTRAQPQTTP